MKIFKKINDILNVVKNRVLELVHKNEEPKAPIVEEKKSLLTPEVRSLLEEIESRFSGSMSIAKDIIAIGYLNKGYSSKEVADIFNVSETTIKRRHKMFKTRINQICISIMENTVLTCDEVSLILEEYYGPKFEIDEYGEITMLV